MRLVFILLVLLVIIYVMQNKKSETFAYDSSIPRPSMLNNVPRLGNMLDTSAPRA